MAASLALAGCGGAHDGAGGATDAPAVTTSTAVPATTASTTQAANAAPVTTVTGIMGPLTVVTAVNSALAASPIVAGLTRQGGRPTIRTSQWPAGGGGTARGMAVQLTYPRDVRLVGRVPFVTSPGGSTYGVERIRVDATARRFLVYVDARSGPPRVVGITAGE